MTPRLRSWLLNYSFIFKNGKNEDTDVYETDRDWQVAFKKFCAALQAKRDELAKAA